MSNDSIASQPQSKPGQPDPFQVIRAEIERSKKLLDLKPDWDGEGSPAYSKEVWQRATNFLDRYAHHLFSSHDIIIPAPKINPGPDGSIDVHWKTPQFELLLNFPADPRLPAGFYGDDHGLLSIKGKMKTDGYNQGLLLWLMEHV
jgi:hypothetical protein